MEKMMQTMVKRYPMMIGIGFLLVVASVIIAYFNAANAEAYYAVDKAARDASVELAQIRAGIESTVVWLPYLKFLGVAMILSGITMALGVIATRLQSLGQEVMSSVPAAARVAVPGRPGTAMLMRLFMMMGMAIIIVGFVLAIRVGGTAASVFSNPIVAIDSAESGSLLLGNLARMHAAEAWLEAFKFVGIASLFMGIVNGLATILFALGYQKKAIPQVVEQLPPLSAGIPVGSD